MGLNAFDWRQIFALDSVAVKTQNIQDYLKAMLHHWNTEILNHTLSFNGKQDSWAIQ